MNPSIKCYLSADGNPSVHIRFLSYFVFSFFGYRSGINGDVFVNYNEFQISFFSWRLDLISTLKKEREKYRQRSAYFMIEKKKGLLPPLRGPKYGRRSLVTLFFLLSRLSCFILFRKKNKNKIRNKKDITLTSKTNTRHSIFFPEPVREVRKKTW